MGSSSEQRIGWSEQIPSDKWEVYSAVLSEARSRGLPFALGGAFATATYTGRWRNTKDLDLYVLYRDRDAMVEVLMQSGFRDYAEQQPYDHGWIYRGIRDDAIVDIIWSMANRRAQVDEIWIHAGPEIVVKGERLQVVPAEELLWNMLYVLQRDRCDWPECLNLLYAVGPGLEWRRLFNRFEEDSPLLAAALLIFTWLAPGRAAELPNWVWKHLNIPAPSRNDLPKANRHRIELLDSRPWTFF